MKASDPTIMFYAFIPIIFVFVLANLCGVHPLKCYSNLAVNYDGRNPEYDYSQAPNKKWNAKKQDFEQPLLFKTWIGYNETQCHPNTTECLKAVCKGQEIRACNDWGDYLQCLRNNQTKLDHEGVSSIILKDKDYENCTECAMCNTNFCNSAFGLFGGGGGSKLFINFGGGIKIPFNANLLMLAFAMFVAVGIGQFDGTFGHVAIGGV